MPSVKETFKAFDSRSILTDKLQALEKENKRLNATLKEEARLRKAFMEEAKREIDRAGKMMDEKIAAMQKEAMESIKQVAAVNQNLADALGDKEDTLRRMSGVAAKLKVEQEREKCKCKLAGNVCKKLKERNDELERDKEAILREIERVKAENDRLTGDLIKCKNQINSLSKVILANGSCK